MAEVIYEYTAYTDATDYNSNPAYIVDLDDNTFGAATAGNGVKIINLNTNQCVGTNLGTITKVEILAKTASYDANAINNVKANYGGVGTYGDNKSVTTAPQTPTEYVFDITADTNAPSPWTWTDVQNLDLYFNGSTWESKPDIYYGKLRITYSKLRGGFGFGNPWIFMKEAREKHDKLWKPKGILVPEGI